MSKILEIAKVDTTEHIAANGNKYILIITKATKVNGLITASRRICVFDDFDLYEVGDRIEVE